MAIIITRAKKPIAIARNPPATSIEEKNPISHPKSAIRAKLLVPAKARPPN
jgi:hypothetical protein